jgi:hypothetical protein
LPSTSEKNYIGDLVRHEFNEAYNFEALVLAAATTVPVNSDLLGYPVVVSGTTATIQTAAQVTAFTATSSCNVIADDTPAVAAFSATPSTAKYRVLRRGPAVVHRQGLKTADPAAANYDMTKYIAALLVAGIVVVNETGLTNTIS